MRMASGGIKGLSAVIVAWMTWIDKTFTPLFWVLLVLVALDLLLAAHKEGQQFAKIGSMAVSLGVPGYAAANLANPELGKYLVAIMCIVYLQIVVPQLLSKLQGITFSKDPKQNAITQEELAALVAKAMAVEKAKAEAVVKEVAPTQPTNAEAVDLNEKR